MKNLITPDTNAHKVDILMDYEISNEHKEAIQFLGYLNGEMKDTDLDKISKKANREILDDYYLCCRERLLKWHLSFKDKEIANELEKISKERINKIIDNYISAQAGNKIEDRMTLGEYEFATNMLEHLNYLIYSARNELNISTDVFHSSLSANKRENINNLMNDIKQQDPELHRSLKLAAKEYLHTKTQIISKKKHLNQSVMPNINLNLNAQINKPKEIKKSNNNINDINYNIEDKEDEKEEPKDNINENLNIGREHGKIKKIDVKKGKKLSESLIIDNDDLNEMRINKTTIINPKTTTNYKFNPRTKINTKIEKKKLNLNLNKNKVNQSMMVPNMKNNIKIEDKKEDKKVETEKKEAKFSKKNVNDKKNNINNQK